MVDDDGRRTRITLARPTSMDRDIALCATAPTATGSQVQLAPDGDGWVVHMSYRPDALEQQPEAPPRAIKIVLDCSGSMGGDAIAQVRVAGERILDSLRPGDHFDIVAFGSSHRMLFGRALPATGANVDSGRDFVRSLDADMGGTEIGAALDAAYGIPTDTEVHQPHVLLITDGQAWDSKPVIDAARRSGYCVFTVGVGSTAVEPFVRGLAEATRGACELVVPNDDMAGRIHRHFQRILGGSAKFARVRWPASPSHTSPDPLPPPYSGDTMHIFGWFDDMPDGEIIVELDLADGTRSVERFCIPTPPSGTQSRGPGAAELDPFKGIAHDIPRLGAACRLAEVRDPHQATALATRYRLVSEWTHCVALAIRVEADKATDLPTLVKVPHVMAAGWHGLGTVMEHRAPTSIDPPLAAAERFSDQSVSMRGRSHFRRRATAYSRSLPSGDDHADFVATLRNRALPPILSIDYVRDLGLSDEVVEALERAVDTGGTEHAVVVAFLHLMCRSEPGRTLDRAMRRHLRRAYRSLSLNAGIEAAVGRAFELWRSAEAQIE